MLLNKSLLLVALCFVLSEAFYDFTKCPSGGDIYAHGIEEKYKQVVVDIHNKYRSDVASGRVPGQPRGVNLKRMYWDNRLSAEGAAVSKTCQMKHVIASDNRFSWVGQNLYISWSSVKSGGQDWGAAIKSWFDEYKYFTYPHGSRNGQVVGHYTQLVWADTYLVGCDFISFYDVGQPRFPYAKLYTCNYGPGGNIQGQAPYKTG